MAAKIVVARESFAYEHRGDIYVVHAGSEHASNSVAVKGREELFEAK